MHIVSDFHDYYDNVMITGRDEALRYQRQRILFPVGVKLPDEKMAELVGLLPKPIIVTNEAGAIAHFMIFVVAGVIHIGMELKPLDSAKRSEFIYGKDAIRAFFSKSEPLKEKLQLHERLNRRHNSGFSHGEFIEMDESRHFFEFAKKMKWPIIYVGRDHSNRLEDEVVFEVNLFLMTFNFESRMTDVEIFQEISMFIGACVSCEEKEIKVADKYRISAHGFDKQSFRKRSAGKSK